MTTMTDGRNNMSEDELISEAQTGLRGQAGAGATLPAVPAVNARGGPSDRVGLRTGFLVA